MEKKIAQCISSSSSSSSPPLNTLSPSISSLSPFHRDQNPSRQFSERRSSEREQKEDNASEGREGRRQRRRNTTQKGKKNEDVKWNNGQSRQGRSTEER